MNLITLRILILDIFKNKNEYIKAMTKLINNKTLLKEMSYNARESSNEYLLSTFAKKVLNVYTKAINNYNNMINEEEYDSSKLEELNVYDTVYKQPNRKNCALLPFRAVGEILDKK